MAEQTKSSLLDSLFGGSSDVRSHSDDYQRGYSAGSKDSSEENADSDYADCLTGIFHKAKREALRDSD